MGVLVGQDGSKKRDPELICILWHCWLLLGIGWGFGLRIQGFGLATVFLMLTKAATTAVVIYKEPEP